MLYTFSTQLINDQSGPQDKRAMHKSVNVCMFVRLCVRVSMFLIVLVLYVSSSTLGILFQSFFL